MAHQRRGRPNVGEARRLLRTIHRMVCPTYLGGNVVRAHQRPAEPRSGRKYRPAPVRPREPLTERLEMVLWSVTYWLSRARGGIRDER